MVDAVDGQEEAPLDVELAAEGTAPALGGDGMDTHSADSWGAGAGVKCRFIARSSAFRSRKS